MRARSWRRVAGALDRHPLSTSLLYRAAARIGFGALPFAARFSPKLAGGMAGRRASVATLESWAASHRDRSRPLLWFHAPSVGEGLQARAILDVLRARHPDWQIAFTHFSPSAEAAAARQPADVHAYLPADIPADVDAALDALAPNALVFVKLDVWPELASRAAARGVPVLLVAATVSPVSGRTGWPARAFTRAGYEAIAQRRRHRGRRRQAARDSRRTARPHHGHGRPALRQRERDGIGRLRGSAAHRADRTPRRSWPARPGDRTMRFSSRPTPSFGAPMRGVRLILAPHEPTSKHLDAVDALAARFGLQKPVRLALATGREDFILVDRVGVLARLYGCGRCRIRGRRIRARRPALGAGTRRVGCAGGFRTELAEQPRSRPADRCAVRAWPCPSRPRRPSSRSSGRCGSTTKNPAGRRDREHFRLLGQDWAERPQMPSW